MIHTLTLIVFPQIHCAPTVRKALQEEHFTMKHGSYVTAEGSESVIGVACADFHDVGVVLDKASGFINPRVFLVDARQRVYRIKPGRNTIESCGQALGYDCEHAQPATQSSYVDFGGQRWYFYAD